MNRAVPRRIASVPLTDARGRRTSLAALRGKVVVLVDSTTLCQETCPLDTANFAQMARTLEHAGLGDKVRLVEVTMDPRRDTVARQRAYQKLFGRVPSNWTFVRSTPDRLARLWRFFGFAREKEPIDEFPPPTDWMTGEPLRYDMNHNDVVVFLDRAGHERFVIVGQADARGTPIPATLRRFLNDEGRHDLTHPRGGAWTTSQGLRAVAWLLGHRIPGATPSS